MAKPNKTQNIMDLLQTLDELAKSFNDSAKSDLRIAEALGDAARVVREELTEKKSGMDAFTFLVDGSGSMTFSAQPNHQSPLNSAMDAVSDSYKSGAKVVLWGAPTVVVVDDNNIKAAKKGLNSSSDFMPVIHYMRGALACREQRHFIVLSDGEMDHKEKLVAETEKLLRKYPRATIDFVVEGRRNTEIEKVAKALASALPSQVGFKSVTTFKEHLLAVVDQRATVAATKKWKKTPQPGK